MTILADGTSGSATVDPQSESSSVIAVWNSSSRAPRGISRNASYLPVVMPGRSAAASARKRDQWAMTTRRAVGTTERHSAIAGKISESGSADSVTNSGMRAPSATRERSVALVSCAEAQVRSV